MYLRSFLMDDEFVAKMDKKCFFDGKIDGNKRIRRATTFNQCITSFCRPKFYKQHKFTLERQNFESIYFDGMAIAFSIYVTLICISLYHHYKHEYYLLQLHEFNQTQREFPADHANKIELYLQDRIRTTRGGLISVGAPLISLVDIYPFAVICFYLNWLGYGLLTYVSFVLFFRYVTPVESLYFFRAVQNPRQEQHWTNVIIKEQVNRVLQSSRVYALNLIRAQMKRKGPSHHGHLDDELIQKHISDYEENALLLRKLTLAGKLNPISRSPQWLDTLALYYCLLTYFVYLIIFSTGPLMVCYYMVGVGVMGGLVLVSILGMALIFSGSGVFYLSAIVMTLVDQIRSVEHIHEKVDECIRMNSKRLLIYRQDESGHLYCYGSSELNETLLLILMEYKIYQNLLAEFHPTLCYLTPLCYLILFLVPGIARAHLVYLRIANARLFAILLSLLGSIFCDLFVIGACHFQSRRAKLRQAFSSLQAHISWCTLNTPKGGRSNCYNHTIQLLRYEYLHQDQQPATSSAINYETALKLHFWFSLILISILYDRSDKAVAGLFSDPFNFKKLEFNFLL